jgi:hypothetical protein
MSLYRLNGVRCAVVRAGWLLPSLLCAAGAALWSGPAAAIGSPVDVEVIDRDAGHALRVVAFRGSHYVAGRPGARYAIRVSNRSGARVLAVMSVDGVNIVSGQTASWQQSGYVLEPWQTHEITGWRKSQREVAAFEFTALPDSYAARTGRPDDVGVIGVAVFGERPAVPAPTQELSRDDSRGRAEGGVGAAAERAAPSAAPAPAQDAAKPSAQRSTVEPAQKLGTGHGAREDSYASTTTFVRSSSQPLALVTIQYDRYENLVRAGVIRDGRRTPQPRPFPRADVPGFVPDPPSW